MLLWSCSIRPGSINRDFDLQIRHLSALQRTLSFSVPIGWQLVIIGLIWPAAPQLRCHSQGSRVSPSAHEIQTLTHFTHAPVRLTVLSCSRSPWVCSVCSAWARLLSLSASARASVSLSTWALSSLTSRSSSSTWLSHSDWQPSSFSRSSYLPCSSSCSGSNHAQILIVFLKGVMVSYFFKKGRACMCSYSKICLICLPVFIGCWN